MLLSGALVYASAGNNGDIRGLPHCKLPVEAGGLTTLQLDFTGIYTCKTASGVSPVVAASAQNLAHSLSSNAQNIQGFLSIEALGPSWALEVAMSALASAGALDQVQSLTLVADDDAEFSMSLNSSILQAPNMKALIIDGLEMDLTVLSEMCNSSSLPVLQSVTAQCSRWKGQIMLQRIVQLNLICNTHSLKVGRVAAACFPPQCLQLLRHLTITHKSPEFSHTHISPRIAINVLLNAVVPLLPVLEGLFLDVCGSSPPLCDALIAVLAAVPTLKLLRIGGSLTTQGTGGKLFLALEQLSTVYLSRDLLCLMPGITFLHFSGCALDMPIPYQILPQLPTVKHLSLKLDTLISTEAEDFVDLDSFPSIVSVTFSNREPGWSTCNLVKILQRLQGRQSLTSLVFDGFRFEESALEVLMQLGQLQHLEFIDSTITEQQLRTCLIKMPSLNRMSITGMRPFSGLRGLKLQYMHGFEPAKKFTCWRQHAPQL